jgi:hypothetical protein
MHAEDLVGATGQPGDGLCDDRDESITRLSGYASEGSMFEISLSLYGWPNALAHALAANNAVTSEDRWISDISLFGAGLSDTKLRR